MAKTTDYGFGPYTFPRGWFIVGLAIEATSKPKALRYFARDLVMYRGQSGKVIVLDAICPHMGTNIAKNDSSYVVLDGKQIQGDSILCPYHAWKFDADGQCTDIPYSPAPIPKKACVKAFPAREWGGFVMVWYDEEGNPPMFEPPELPQWDDPSWVKWKVDNLGQLPVHQAEIVDNISDKAHLEPIHGTQNYQYFENEFKGHKVWQRLAAGHRTLSDDILVNDTWYTGPALLMSRMKGYYDSLMLIAHTPIEDGVLQAWHALMVKTPNTPPSKEDLEAVEQFQNASLHALSQDFDIWANKGPALQIMQVVGDGPFGKVRTWFSQFFNPVEEAAAIHKKVDGVIVTKGTNRDPW